MNVKVKVYDDIKYNMEAKKVCETEYKNVKNLNVVELDNETVSNMGFDEFDEMGEYCILTFEDETTATFRNSHIDVFKM